MAMWPVVGTLGGSVVYSFWVVAAAAALIAGAVATSGLHRQGVSWFAAGLVVLLVVAGGVAGARLWWLVATHGPDPRDWSSLAGGLVWWGGVFGGGAVAVVLLRSSGHGVLRGLDALAPAAALGLAIGRLGCHLAGDGDWGTPTRLPWGVSYRDGLAGWPFPLEVRVHPAALYESAASGAVFAWTARVQRAGVPAGHVLAWWALLAGLARAFIEAVRTNPPLACGLTAAQWVGIACAAVGGIALARPAALGRVGARSPSAR